MSTVCYIYAVDATSGRLLLPKRSAGSCAYMLIGQFMNKSVIRYIFQGVELVPIGGRSYDGCTYSVDGDSGPRASDVGLAGYF